MSKKDIALCGFLCLLVGVLIASVLLVGSGGKLQAQPASNTCPVGQSFSQTIANVGAGCSPVTGQLGNAISVLGLTGALTSQTVCDTSGICPAGFYTLQGYVNVSATGTLVSAVSSFLTFTDDVQTNTVSIGPTALSLLTKGQSSLTYNFYHVANTAVTINTTTTTLTGSPTYGMRAILLLHKTPLP